MRNKKTSLWAGSKRVASHPEGLILARFPDFRIILLEAPSHPSINPGQWCLLRSSSVTVAGTVPDLHRFPLSPYLNFNTISKCTVPCQEKNKKEKYSVAELCGVIASPPGFCIGGRGNLKVNRNLRLLQHKPSTGEKLAMTHV